MQVLSPYGKNVFAELKNIYGFKSVESAAKFVVRHVQQQYRFQNISVEMLHIAYGLVAKLKADSAIYYLKFASRSMHNNPEHLFPWLNYARNQGIPIPEVIPATNRKWYLSPLKNIDSDYDVVYLMRQVPGNPMQRASKPLLRQYAEAMAQFHRVGFLYPNPVLGSDATWQGKWNNRRELWINLKDYPLISQALLRRAMQAIEETKPLTLPKTILHGDFRLCHVFFQDESLSGLIDVDQSTQGERFIDLCYGLVSGSLPEGGNLLTFEQLQNTLSIYHKCLPLNEVEQSILKAAFAYAILETLNDLCEAKATKQDINATQTLLSAILNTSAKELLLGM
jgi:Ser/Thr protein kinase RdoA (MazF antagonist)